MNCSLPSLLIKLQINLLKKAKQKTIELFVYQKTQL